MSDTTLTIRTDSTTKRAIADFATSQAIRDGQLTLIPVLEPTPYLEKIMRDVNEDLEYNRNVIHTNSKEEAISHLKSLMS